MRSKVQQQTLSRITEIEIGLEDSAVVQVEAGEAQGYMISESYAVGEIPSEITLRNVMYLYAHGQDFQVAEAPEVLVRTKDDYWFAAETGDVLLIPCPSKEPYPIVFISKHGFEWMGDMIRHGNVQRVIEHLTDRFQLYDFVTSRSILKDPSLPFSHASCIGTTPANKEG